MEYLEVVDPQGQRRLFSLRQTRLLLGRDPECDIQLPHPAISRYQAQLQFDDQGQWVLQDLSPLSNILFNNRPVKHLLLETGQLFRIGDFRVTLKEEAGDPTIEIEQWGDTPHLEVRPTSDASWLEPLQTFQRSVRTLTDPKLLLDSLAREYQRILKPELLAIGRQTADGYRWDRVYGEAEGDTYRLALDQADRQRARASATMHSWVNLPTPTVATEADAPEQASLLIPLKGRRGSLGHIYVDRPAVNPVPVNLRRYLSLVAGYAGLVLENLELGESSKVRAQFERELQHAREIQLGLFPNSFSLDPRLDAFGVNLPSTQVSGDYFDLFRIAAGRIAFVVADAMGHGMPAALLMATVRAALRMGLCQQLDWRSVFAGLHQLVNVAKDESYVTGIVGEIDLERSEIWLVSAGHPPPSIVVDGDLLPFPEECRTLPWGVEGVVDWEPRSISIAGESWSLLAFTDGISELAGTDATSGIATLHEYHRQNADHSAEDLCQGILYALRNRPSADDQTVLAIGSPK